jgi:CHAT domain-containing protein/tetratricopeptide (TPR) repeat protein
VRHRHVAWTGKPGAWRGLGELVATASILLLLLPQASLAAAQKPRCDALDPQATGISEWQFDVDIHSRTQITISLPAGGDFVLAATESNADVVLEIIGDLRADNPVRRTGTQLLLLHMSNNDPIRLSGHTKPHAAHAAHVLLRAFDMNPRIIDDPCVSIVRAIAGADSAYAEGQAIVAGQSTGSKASATSQFQFAEAQYRKAFELAGPEAPPHLRARLAHALAAISYQDLHRWRDSERWAAAASSFYDLAKDPYNRARAQALQAAARMELATLPEAASANEAVRSDSHALLLKAIAQLHDLAQFHAVRGELYDQALQLNNIGLALYYQGLNDDAIAAYRKALPIYAQLGERYRQAQVFQNIAVANGELNRYAAAIVGYQHALALLNSEESPKLYADTLNNCALANLSLGHLEEALQQNEAALEIFTHIQDQREQGRSLFGIARVYAAAGNYPLADVFLRQSLAIRSATLDARGRVDTLLALSFVATQEDREEEALQYNQEAITIAVDPAVRVRALNHLAEAQSLRGEQSDAMTSIAFAGDVARNADRASRATVALERSGLESRAGHLTQAQRDGRFALASFRRLGLDVWTFDSYVALAKIEGKQGRSSDAIRDLNRAIDISEHIRNQAAGAELRAGLMQSLRPAFDLKIDLLAVAFRDAVSLGDKVGARQSAAAALQTAERYRARAMRDIAGTRLENLSNEVLQDLIATKSALLTQISVLRSKLGQPNAGTPPSNDIEGSTELAGLLQRMSSLDARIASAGNVSTRQGYLDFDSAHLIEKLPPRVALVSYWFTSSKLYAWVAVSGQLEFCDLGNVVSIRSEASRVHAVHNAIQSETPETRFRSSDALAQSILDPLLHLIPRDTTKLVIIPDGLLHYIPFAALPTSHVLPPRFLINDFDIVYAPGIATVLEAPAASQPMGGRMLLVDDAVYGSDDPRWAAVKSKGAAQPVHIPAISLAIADSSGSHNYARLPGTADEAGTIARRMPAETVDRLEGFKATRAAVLGSPLETYRYIHFAVHGTTDADIPQLSSIVLSSYNETGERIQDRVWAGDLLTRRFNAETIVFSACDTALGKRVAGEGLVGLRYMALARGAKSVVASLWPVPDRVTSELMNEFYGQLLDHGRPPGDALAIAMRRMISTGITDSALWAPFTVSISTIAK